MLRVVNGTPILGYLLNRLLRCETLTGIVVATSVETDDTAIERFCEARDIACIRGPLDDVAARFRLAVAYMNADAFIRISGDSPLMDPVIVDRAVRMFASENCDLVTNVRTRTFPKGQSVEVMRTSTFMNASGAFEDAADKEHVTTYFYRHADRFRIASFENDRNLGDMSMAIDTAEDFARFGSVVGRMKRPQTTYHLDDLIDLYAMADRT